MDALRHEPNDLIAECTVVAVVDVPQVVDAQHHEADPRALHRLHTTTHVVLELELVEKTGQRVDLALLSQVRDEPGEQQRLSLRVEDEPAAASQTHPFAFAVDGAILHPMARRARIGDFLVRFEERLLVVRMHLRTHTAAAFSTTSEGRSNSSTIARG